MKTTALLVMVTSLSAACCSKEVRGGGIDADEPEPTPTPWVVAGKHPGTRREPGGEQLQQTQTWEPAQRQDVPHPVYPSERLVTCKCYVSNLGWTEGICSYLGKGVWFRVTIDAAPLLLPNSYCNLVY